MRKEKALKKLNELIKKANFLLNDNPLVKDKIEEWNKEVFKAITYIFPDKNEYIIDFTMAGKNTFSLENDILLEDDNYILKDETRERKEIIIKMIKEIQDFWEDENTVLLAQQPKQIIKQREIKKMKNIFISHITEEKEVAIILKKLIEEIFPGQTEIFVSSDGISIVAGTKWLDEISKALNQADLLITLCSEMSIKRPWINFELGAGWIKGIPIIPVCYLGITKKQLPQPIAMLQAMDLINDSSLKYMFEGIAKHLQLTLPNRLHFESMMKDVTESFGKVKYIKATTKEQIKAPDNALDEEFYGKKELCKKILMLYKDKNHKLPIVQISKILDINEQITEYYTNKLKKDAFLHVHYSTINPKTYSLANKGREYMIMNEIIK